MKLAEVEPGMYVELANDSTRCWVVDSIVVVDGNWCGYYTKPPKVKKVRCRKLELDATGATLVAADWTDDFMPNQLVRAVPAEQALKQALANREYRMHLEWVRNMHDACGDDMVAALAAAGFPGARCTYDGVKFDKAAVAKWADAQGMHLTHVKGA